MKEGFRLPIEFLNNKTELNSEMIDDLELLHSKTDGEKCLYDYVFESNTKASEIMKVRWSKYYTSNTIFLKDSQKIYENIDNNVIINNDDESKILTLLENIENEDNFEERYLYINNVWFCDKLNMNEQIMFAYSLLLILLPIATLISPLMMLILPFLIIKLLNKNITISEYVSVIKELLKKIPIGKLLDINLKNMKSTLYAIFSAGMYVFQLYQNTKTCISLKNKTYDIMNKLKLVGEYLKKTSERIEVFLKQSDLYESYDYFNKELRDKLYAIKKYVGELEAIGTDNIFIVKNIGYIRCLFYDLYKNADKKELLNYSLECNGYLDSINAIKINIGSVFGKTKYVDGDTKISKMFYPAIKGKKVKNTICLKKNYVITGVNASGKTTLIKSILLNVLLSQQIGYGFFEKQSLNVFDRLHCYLNIPDTSGRDSLFQAEARRCKDIIDTIDSESSKRHLCIFDELYSGTNPYEATVAGYSYIRYLCKHTNVRFLLTTHYLEMCEKLEHNNKNNVLNCHMSAFYKDDELTFTYKKKNGITKIHGGIEILKKLDYPEEIIIDAKNTFNCLKKNQGVN